MTNPIYNSGADNVNSYMYQPENNSSPVDITTMSGNLNNILTHAQDQITSLQNSVNSVNDTVSSQQAANVKVLYNMLKSPAYCSQLIQEANANPACKSAGLNWPGNMGGAQGISAQDIKIYAQALNKAAGFTATADTNLGENTAGNQNSLYTVYNLMWPCHDFNNSGQSTYEYQWNTMANDPHALQVHPYPSPSQLESAVAQYGDSPSLFQSQEIKAMFSLMTGQNGEDMFYKIMFPPGSTMRAEPANVPYTAAQQATLTLGANLSTQQSELTQYKNMIDGILTQVNTAYEQAESDHQPVSPDLENQLRSVLGPISRLNDSANGFTTKNIPSTLIEIKSIADAINAITVNGQF